MIDRKSERRGSIRLVFCALALGASCSQAFSQWGPTAPPRAIFYSTVQPLTDTIARVQSDPRPKTAEGALQALDWLIYGHLNAGGAYDSNEFASPNAVAAYGLQIQPSIVAARNTGTQRTLVYGVGDFRYYPSQGQIDIFNTTAGVAHVWEIYRDLIFRGQLEASFGEQNSSLVNSTNGSGVLYTKPFKYTSLFGSTSIEKSFGRFFTAIGGSVTGNIYKNTTDNLGNSIDETFQNGTRATLNGRVGYHLSPIVYTFVEPSVNWGQFQGSNLNSNGYRVVGGLGTARIGLFNGEIYGGTLTEYFSDPSTPTLSRPIYGGRISWFPTRFVTVTGSFDQSLGTSDFSPTLFQNGSATIVDTARLVASWAMLRDVTLEGNVQFQHYKYLGSNRLDDLTVFGVKSTYMFAERLGITLEYRYAILDSNTPGVAYNRNFVGLGATSRF
jgi:Putative beta-barrel porin 2